MRRIEQINIKNIVVDKHSISKETFDLAYKIKTNKLSIEYLPPIKLEYIKDGTYKLKDGRHRITAFKLLGIKSIKSKFYKK